MKSESSGLPSVVIRNLQQRFKIKELIGCGTYACAWQMEDGRVCKFTNLAADAEHALRVAKIRDEFGPIFDDVLVIIDEVQKFTYPYFSTEPDEKPAPKETGFVILSERLHPLDMLINYDLVNQISLEPHLLNLKNYHERLTSYDWLSVAITEVLFWIEGVASNEEGARLSWVPDFEAMGFEGFIDILKASKPVFLDIPEDILKLVVHKFIRLHEASIEVALLQGPVNRNTEAISNLVRDAHSGNWGLRDATDLTTAVLFDLGSGYPDPKFLGEKLTEEWRRS